MDTFLYGRICKCDSGNMIQLILSPILVNRLYAAGVIQPAYKG